MNNTKITQVSSAIIHESDFMNKSSYRRFMKGFDRAFEIQQLKDEGYIIFIDGKPMDKDENFIFGDLRDKPCFGTTTPRHTLSRSRSRRMCTGSAASARGKRPTLWKGTLVTARRTRSSGGEDA